MSTIREIIRRTLPNGTRPDVAWNILPPKDRIKYEQAPAAWNEVPLYPTDCFAVVAQLLEQSGAYHHIRMRPPSLDGGPGEGEELQKRANALLKKHHFSDAQIKSVLGKLGDPTIREVVHQLVEHDRPPWCLRMAEKEHQEWIILGRAWSLMLPFIESPADRSIVMWGAQEWLITTAQTGHDPLWFYKHELEADAITALEHALDRLNAEAKKIHNYHSIERWKIENLLHTHFSGGKSVMNVMNAYHRDLLRLNAEGHHSRQLQAAWDVIWKNRDEQVFVQRTVDGKSQMPGWWEAAFKLLIACDEACIRMGTLAGEYFDAFRLGAARAAVALYVARGTERFKKATREDDQFESPTQRTDLLKQCEWTLNPRRFVIDISRDIHNVFRKGEPNETEPSDEESRRSRRDIWKRKGFTFPWADLIEQQNDKDNDPAWYDELRSISFTFSGLSDNDYVCVFPKSRIPKHGNTIRNVTNHLALLPPRGIAQATLRRGEEKAFSRNKEFNVLLVPYPFRITASAFGDAGSAFTGDEPKDDRRGAPNWKWFDLNQDWLKGLTGGHLTSAIDILCRAACREVKEIDAIVFPELALNYETYANLALHISQNHPSIEIFVAGTSQRPQRARISERIEKERESKLHRHNFLWKWKSNLIRLSYLSKIKKEDLTKGNFVATTTFLRYGKEDVSTYLTTFQQKHHRWRLDEGQIMRYGIWSKLDPSYDWWENIETSNRNIEFSSFRGGSTLVALVCEDLARLEPCQQLIRSIGPNLVVALLLDGPQKTDRWSARYATVLADDPGSSVLSLTSMGLMPRATDTHTADARCIGLWKDAVSGQTREIHLPDGSHAAVLTLTGVRQTEHTVDGRDDAGLAVAWKFKSCIPIHDSALSQDLPPEFLGRGS